MRESDALGASAKKESDDSEGLPWDCKGCCKNFPETLLLLRRKSCAFCDVSVGGLPLGVKAGAFTRKESASSLKDEFRWSFNALLRSACCIRGTSCSCCKLWRDLWPLAVGESDGSNVNSLDDLCECSDGVL